MIYSNMGIMRETFGPVKGIHRGYTRGLYWDSGKENETTVMGYAEIIG